MGRRSPTIRGFGTALDLATQLGWAGPVSGLSAETPSVTVPDVGEMVDVSVFALQDMLTILGFYRGEKDGNWSDAVMQALTAWAGTRFTITVIPKEGDSQTVSFRRQVFDRLKFEADAVIAHAKPWYFWPLVITGTIAGIYLLTYIFSKGRRRGTSEFSTSRKHRLEDGE